MVANQHAVSDSRSVWAPRNIAPVLDWIDRAAARLEDLAFHSGRVEAVEEKGTEPVAALDPLDFVNEEVLTRFYSRYEPGDADACWLWKAGKTRGFGTLEIVGRTVRAHRLAYYLATGEKLPSSVMLQHSCHNRACMNPAHLLPKEGNPQRTKGIKADSAYVCWRSMINRCENANYFDFDRYGGRGICVHPIWRKPGGSGFRRFRQDVGARPTLAHSIHRINNDGDYEPGNTRWATPAEQAEERAPESIEYKGTRRSLAVWADVYQLSPLLIRRRLALGWPIAKALETPASPLRKPR